MATAFTAFGKGNGFPFCLGKISIGGTYPSKYALGNTTTLEQTMNAYWNFDNASFGEASFDPVNEPKDLICNPYDNLGFDRVGVANSEAEYTVEHNKPVLVVDGNSTYYSHGIKFSYYDVAYPGGNPGVYYSEINYTGGWYVDNTDPYECTTIYKTPSPHSPPFPYGKDAGETTVTATNVTISGLPFKKLIIQSWYESTGSDICPTSQGIFPSLPSELPTLNFHTY
tara:strand:- start:592 stop:1269 length:678 start_codon:yes stop_codon:yes gene_type:complete